MTDSEFRLVQMARAIGRYRGQSETGTAIPEITAGPAALAEPGEIYGGEIEMGNDTVSHQGDCLVSLLASSSRGNAAYIRCGHTHLLIDAGISCRRIEKGLRRFGAELSDLDAVFITHEHTDHVSGLPVLLKRTHVPVYPTAETWRAMGPKVAAYQNCFVQLPRRLSVGEVQVVPFATSHDAARSVGYSVYHEGCKITLATDLGIITPSVMAAAAWSDILILEANHDEELLRHGPYPYALQQRILGPQGHLSNTTAAQFLAQLPRRSLTKVLLAHRSEHNNTPAITVHTMRRVLADCGVVIGQDVLLRLASASGSVHFQSGGNVL